jgi:esterase/lipase
MFFKWLLITLAFSSISRAAPAAELGPCDSWIKATGAPKGVVLVTHGMNLKPACMDELAQVLAKVGYEVLRPAFTGHCGGNEKYLNVKAADWEADARRYHALAAAKAQALKKPLHLVAYSFTALIYQTMEKDLPFERRVYLAPPFSTKFWYPLLRWVAGTFPNLTYESKNITACAANVTSGARGFLAMDHFLQRWQSGEGRRYEKPILTFAEPNDELVSYDGLVTFSADKNNWQLERVTNKGSTLPKTYHHLIVDTPSLGAEEFRRLSQMAVDFLGR